MSSTPMEQSREDKPAVADPSAEPSAREESSEEKRYKTDEDYSEGLPFRKSSVSSDYEPGSELSKTVESSYSYENEEDPEISAPVVNEGTPFDVDFVLCRSIGRGGQNDVWQAWQTSLHRQVAVKIFREGSMVSFLQEAYTSAELDHPNIVPTYELSRTREGNRDVLMLAMKLVDGNSWETLIALDRAESDFYLDKFLAKHLPILVGVCNAVAYAHSKKIIHRDLKPSQVMIGKFGEVLLMDWGLAIFIGTNPARIPKSGITKYLSLDEAVNPAGTPAYMAPEQADYNTTHLGTHTDIYLLGGILYELLAGHPPFPGRSIKSMLRTKKSKELVPLPGDCPDELAQLVKRALSQEIGDRPATVEEFRRGIEDYLSGTSRRRKSLALTAEARTILERERLSEDEVAECDNFLSRALSHWPANTEALDLQRQSLMHHIKLARERGDSRLAKILALRLPPSDERAVLLNELNESENQTFRHEIRKRYSFIVMGVVGMIFLVLMGNFLHNQYNVWQEGYNHELRTLQLKNDSLAQQIAQMSDLVQVQQTSPTDQLRSYFGDLLDNLDGPLPLSDQRRIVKGTPLKIVCLIAEHVKNKKVHITGNIPELGQWTPNELPFDYVGENANGHLWARNVTYQTMDFKLTYGDTGSGTWEGEEWTGPPNRTLPSSNAALYRDQNGNLILFCVYSVVPGTDYEPSPAF